MAGANIRQSVRPAAKPKEGRAALKSGIVILFLVALVVGYYYYLSNRQLEKEPEAVKVTAVREVLARDLSHNYPPTVKEVVRYYSDITKCFYNEEYTDEELEKMAAQTRLLYDDALVDANEWGQYIIELKNDIDYYRTNSIRVNSYSLPASTDVDYFEEDGFDFARFRCTYNLVSNGVKQPVEEMFLLRKDEVGHWRIYGWDLAENVKIEE